MMTLSQTLPVKSKAKRHSSHEPSTKRRKLDDGNSAASTSTYTQEFQSKYPPKPANLVSEDDMKNGESLSRLRRMIRGEIPPEEFNDQQRLCVSFSSGYIIYLTWNFLGQASILLSIARWLV